MLRRPLSSFSRWLNRWSRWSAMLSLTPVLLSAGIASVSSDVAVWWDPPRAATTQYVEGFSLATAEAEAYMVDYAEIALFGYSPQRMREYLGLLPEHDGAGTTIAVVVAFHDPNIVEELNTFSTRFSLPRVCGATVDRSCFVLDVIQPTGKPPVQPVWAKETALDVEWVHAIAPRARIVLVEAIDDTIESLGQAIDAAAKTPGVSVISNSWGGEALPEFDRHCALAAVLCVFAAGNHGIRDDILTPAPTVAQSPYVLVVGGTRLALEPDGQVHDEVAWSGSSGGMSRARQIPSYQLRVRGLVGRAQPDVSFNADAGTGVAVYYIGSNSVGRWAVFGGTSAGAPQWAALVAIAAKLRGQPFSGLDMELQELLYRNPDVGLFDVVEGRNGRCERCFAVKGWDFATGLGSPRRGILGLLSRPPVRGR